MAENPYTAPSTHRHGEKRRESLTVRFFRVSMTLVVGAVALLNVAACTVLFPDYASLLIEHGTLPAPIICYAILFPLSAVVSLYSAHQWYVGNFFRGAISFASVMVSMVTIPNMVIQGFIH